jgi:hypothetical protein
LTPGNVTASMLEKYCAIGESHGLFAGQGPALTVKKWK